MSPSQNELSYQVLYYKRKNKVHQNKGVAKMDGRLIVSEKSVKLYGESSSKAPIFSSLQQFDTLSVDVELTLGHFQVEIVAMEGNKEVLLPKPTETGCVLLKKNSTTSLLRRKPLVPLQTTSLSLTSKKPATSWRDVRKPPAQPKKEDSSDEEDSEEEENTRTLPLCKPLASSRSLIQNKRRKLSSAQTFSIATAVTTDDPLSLLPPSIRNVLRPHQEEGVGFLFNSLLHRNGAILADSMGMGKTLQTIATIALMHRCNKQLRYIIVCPSSLVQNWAKEFDKFLGKASQPKRVVVTRGGDVGIPKLKAFCPIKPQMSEVLIVSYDLFRIHASLLTKAQQIGILVVDEGHRLKNSAGSLTCDALSQLDSASRLLISGTPLQNNLCEFYTLGDFVIPGVLGDLNDFRKDFERPITAASAKGASREEKLLGEQQSQALEIICKTFMIRRLAKDVLAKMLPPRREVLLFCRPSELQCQLYREVTEQAPADPLSTLTSLRKLCSHPNLLNENSSPMIESSGKLVILGKLLHKIRETSPTDKVVLVSCFTSTLTLIQDMLIRPNGWTFTRLDGTTAQTDRQPLVDAFNRTSAQKSYIFLLSSKAGGVGLNLVGANRLVMFDADYNPAIDAQAMARIYRPGQTKPCFIYRFFTSGTTEEVVYQRQLKKSNLATMTVDRSESDFNRFSRDELRDCFTLKHCACDTMTKLSWPNELTNLTDDAALIALTKDKWLGYVHVVPSEVPKNIVEDDGQGGDNEIHKDDEEEEEVGDDEPSEEEFEFDG